MSEEKWSIGTKLTMWGLIVAVTTIFVTIFPTEAKDILKGTWAWLFTPSVWLWGIVPLIGVLTIIVLVVKILRTGTKALPRSIVPVGESLVLRDPEPVAWENRLRLPVPTKPRHFEDGTKIDPNDPSIKIKPEIVSAIEKPRHAPITKPALPKYFEYGGTLWKTANSHDLRSTPICKVCKHDMMSVLNSKDRLFVCPDLCSDVLISALRNKKLADKHGAMFKDAVQAWIAHARREDLD